MADEQYREYFGFDLGDGESAVAWVRADAANEPQILEILGKRNLLTALGEVKGEPCIGDQAFLADADNLYLRFKSRFLTDGSWCEDKLERFARAIFQEIQKSGKCADPERAAFFIGCPSGWKSAERLRYRRIFLRAGFQNVEIISESRAAFMFARESGELSATDELLARPTLIVDAGSSTTDFTFVNEMKALEVFDFGETMLGGGLIDQALWQLNLSRSRDRARIQWILEKCPQYAARCEMEARKVKEMYFTRRMLGGGQYLAPCESSVKIYYERPPVTAEILCRDEDMRRILDEPMAALKGQSYLQAYRQGLEGAKSALGATVPEVILLTGGASRMDFVFDIAQEVFPEARVIRGVEPEFCIARGLCYALRIDRKTERFQAEIARLIDSDAVEDIILNALPRLFHTVAPVIAGQLIDSAALESFAKWKLGDLQTLGDLTNDICQSLRGDYQGGMLSLAMKPVTMRWAESLRPALEKCTDPICTRYGLPLTSLRLPSFVDVDTPNVTIDAGEMMDLKLIGAVVDVVIASIVAALLGGGGIALLMAGPIGLVVSFVIGFVASRLGTSYAVNHADKLNVPQFMRAMFTKKAFLRALNKQRPDIEASIVSQLMGALHPPSEGVKGMIKSVSTAIETQLGALADRARLMIH